MGVKYSLQERKQWINSIFPNYREKSWCDNTVFHPSQIKHSFFFERSESYESEIDPSRIVGVEYGFGYNCPTYNREKYDWLDHLSNLKRLDWVIDTKKSQAELINHIHLNSDPKSVLKYGDNYFITSGQHRLCLAKFIEIPRVKVLIQEFKFNKQGFVVQKNFEKNIPKLIDLNLLPTNYTNHNEHSRFTITLNGNYYYISKKLVYMLLKRYKDFEKNKIKAFKNRVVRMMTPVPYNQKNEINNANKMFLLDCDLTHHIKEKNRL